ncbi:hypothetical protein MIH18_14920 [Marinobacter sp. M3C]|uniref:hypothetical protein n=1 Tax=Marinobacter sp. M3C TaxID=2917715 RepID=UPI00200D9157|nr:hypothetical protein [Marinobacter sp. M3C]UQG59037.1 hypothetical protein MIH18_14920 [Marinobacter sp. M3C]
MQREVYRVPAQHVGGDGATAEYSARRMEGGRPLETTTRPAQRHAPARTQISIQEARS